MTDIKSVVVTGGASGIGLDIVEVLSSRNWLVHIVDLNVQALEQACHGLGIPAERAHVANVADEAKMEAVVAKVDAEAPLGAMVNSAGIAMDKPAVDTSVEEFRRIVDINLTGTFICARAAARHWLARRTPGAIVNISSVSGIIGSKGRSAYGPSKAAVNHLTKILATELGRENIRVNAVAPGAIDTPLARAAHTVDVRRQWHERIPQARYGTVREIANVVAFLISDEASYINGQVLAVDGGFVSAGLMDRASRSGAAEESDISSAHEPE